MSLEQQLEIEADMVGSGIRRYLENTARSEDEGRASETSYGTAFINNHLHLVAAEITKRVEKSKERRPMDRGAGAAYWKALANMDAYTLAFITLRTCIDAAIKKETAVSTCIKIGKRIEDEVKLRQFEQVDERMFKNTVNNLKKRNANNYKFMINAFTHAMNFDKYGNPMQMEYFSWDVATKTNIGANLIDVVIATTGHVEFQQINNGRKTESYVVLGQEMLEWITHHKDSVSLLFPMWMPAVIPPRDWTGMNQGGFHSPQAQQACSFVITKVTSNPKQQLCVLREANLSRVYEGINWLQKTRWCVNAEVLHTAQQVWELGLGVGMPSTSKTVIPDFPLSAEWSKDNATEHELELVKAWKLNAMLAYTAEQERIGKCALVSRVLAMAQRFKDEPELYFVWHCDFRSRMYSVASGLAPQSADVGKAMLKFARGKALGSESGERWFKIHGANCYGVDKLSYDNRVKWVDDNKQMLLAIANDPLDHRKLWADTDKPFQFLAWCFEYRDYCTQGQKFVSHLPIALDGTCNGIQHFSAMLRDPVGGKATNLLDSEEPNDIYGQVAEVVRRKLEEDGSEYAKRWLAFGIDRKVCKRPVMTLPYGSTQQSCRDYLQESYFEADKPVFPREELPNALTLLTSIVWASIGEVVIAARAAMAWLQKVAGVLSKANLPIHFVTPSGFEVYQDIKTLQVKQIETVLLGRTRLTIGEATDEISMAKQKNGIAPNFVHSMDAAHLNSTILAAKAHGIEDIAAIHDDYGTYAADTELFGKLIRETFVEQYKGNALQELYDQIMAEHPDLKLPNPPKQGTLDISVVLDSRNFFG